MAKLDKTSYTKAQWKLLKQQRKAAKHQHRARKQAVPIDVNVPVATAPVQTADTHVTGETSIAFVLGNGVSRKSIRLDHIREWGRTYGCNALYRDYAPHYLIAVDAKMINEICEAKWQMRHEVWTNPNKNLEKHPGLHFFKPSQGWSSGPTALWLATEHKHKLFYLLGFDFVGTTEGKLNNIYGSTRNYRKLTDPATYHGNWQRQTGMIIQKYPKNKYVRVVETIGMGYQAEDFKKYQNYSEITVADFRSLYCRPKPPQN